MSLKVQSYDSFQAEVPNNSPQPDFTWDEFPEFPWIPSARYYYSNWSGHRVPLLNAGSPEERREDLKIFYSLQQNLVFPLKVSYAEAREDQVNIPPSKRLPSSEIALSMKTYTRQYPDANSWFFSDRFQFLLSQIPGYTLDNILVDIHRYPLNPSVNAFQVARYLENYLRTGSEDEIRKYLGDQNIQSIRNLSLDYYPLYELFFVLTRFYSPPLTRDQIQLAQRRNSTEFGSDERKFIDSIFHLHIYDISRALQLVDQIQTQPEEAQRLMNTPFSDWIRWGNEYLDLMGTEPQDIQYIGAPTTETSDIYSTWTDQQLVEFLTELNLNVPVRSEFLSRRSWVDHIAGMIQKYRTTNGA